MQVNNRSRRHQNARTPIMAASLVIVACLRAASADYVVNTLADENDGVGSGGISLRDAINAANGAAGMGAALFINDGNVEVRAVRFEGNAAIGGSGGSSASVGGVIAGGGGGGVGANAGAVWDGSDGGFLGGSGGTGGYPGAAGGEGAGGGGGYSDASGGPGGFGGGGGGTGVNLGFGTLTAGAGGFGGGGGGGGWDAGGPTHGGAGGTFGGAGADGSSGSQGGGGGGAGLGGAIFIRAGTLIIADSTFNSNSATGGSGALGGTNGQGKGGAIFVNSGATALVGGASNSGNTASDDTNTTGDDNNVYGTLGILPEVDSIMRADTSPTNAGTVDFTVTFTVAVTGVNVADFSVAASGVSGASIVSVSGSGTSYNVTINTGTGVGTLGLHLIDDDSIVDASSNPLGGSGSGNGSYTIGETYSIDTVSPTIALTTAAASLLNAAFNVTATSSEATTNFDVSDISVGNALAHNFSGSGTSYSFTVTPIGDGVVTVGVNINKFTDAAGNSNAASNVITCTFDGTAPTVSSALPTSFLLSTETSTTFSIVFSEGVTGFSGDEVSVNHTGTSSDAAVVTAIDATNYTVTVSNITGAGSFNITIAAGAASDAAGNVLQTATSSLFVSRTQSTATPSADPDPTPETPETDDGGAAPDTPTSDADPTASDEGTVASETAEDEGVATAAACGACGPVGFMPLITLLSMAALKSRGRGRKS
ncbi:MAG: hypothetical protein JNG88_08025 [Phycisphaerales bacterium]|nr:hypothetical protein [Phycisphaerales bacterium]